MTNKNEQKNFDSKKFNRKIKSIINIKVIKNTKLPSSILNFGIRSESCKDSVSWTLIKLPT